nr:Trk system potassium transporter TrkA [Lachnospiraceae bacterium]
MKIIVAGIGKVGTTLTGQLVADGHDVTVIDRKADILERVCATYDVMGLEGNCATVQTLRDAGAAEADLLIAVTDADEVNLLCCVTARQINPGIHTIVRIRDSEYAPQIIEMRDVFGLSLIVNPERSAAVEIERLLRFPGFLKRESFARGRVELVEFRIAEDSPLADVALRNVTSILKSKVLICAVLRGTEVTLPKGDFVLKAGDRVFMTAPAAALGAMLRDLGIISHKVKRAILGGGGRISLYLAQLLERDGIQVQIIDNDMARCQELARQLPGVSITCGDITVPSTLEKEGLSTADAFAALTGLDELNIVMSLYAVSQKVPIVITKQGHIDELQDIVSGLSLGSIVSPKELCSDIVVRYVRSMRDTSGDSAITVQSVAGGRVEAAEFVIGPASQHRDTPLLDIKIKPGVLIAAISHQGTTTVAGGTSQYTLGDSVIVISAAEMNIQRFNDIFA